MSGWGLRHLFNHKSRKAAEQECQEHEIAAETIEAGDFHIDLAERSATLRGHKLELTSQEFEVLVFLARHPHRLVTPRTMLATSWAAKRPRQTEFLKVLLSLRQKLEAAGGGVHYLRTEPWVLYRFDPASPAA
ncbi:MAG TPA: winged helix-turn-helix domain-containing protein [Terriglobales bacterium]|nr:winged helix-turn-helix domain-containing protein [Terriglobales bacterium]